jgi:cell division transport system permease protein
MAAEAVLLTAGYLWGKTMETRLTVELPAVGDEASISQAERIRQTISVLRAMPNVGQVVPLSDDEVAQLLKPWFNEPELLKALPLPTLIDVERKPGAELSAQKIHDTLKDVVGNARVNDHGAWTQDVWRIMRGLTILGSLTIALTAIALVVAVNLICRTVIATEHETISLLHLMGAENLDIARHFQAQTRGIVLRAAATGFLAAVALIVALFFSTRHIADLSTLRWTHWACVSIATFSVPVCAIAIATIAARLSVMRLIKSFP